MIVGTPTFTVGVLKRDEVTTAITDEFKQNNCWTKRCSELIQQSPMILFDFDRIRYVFGYGGLSVLFLNPWTTYCFACNKTVKLKRDNNLIDYACHLAIHTDTDSLKLHEMVNVYLNEDHFLHNSDIMSHQFGFMRDENSIKCYREAASRHLIIRDIKEPHNYLTQWMAILLKSDIISPSSLIFQEMDAFVVQMLSFPGTVDNWSKWPTLMEYNMCLGASGSEHIHKLFTGGHHEPMARIKISETPDSDKGNETTIEAVKKYSSTINHPGPSYRTVLRSLGPIKLEPGPHHDVLYLHTSILEKNIDKAVHIEGDMIMRFPVSVVFDEQLLNPGVFLFKKTVPGSNKTEIFVGGLDSTVRLEDVSGGKLKDFLNKIGTEVNFVKAVAEFQCMDLANIYSSNALTKFISAAASNTYLQVIGNLDSCLQEVAICQNCRMNGYEDCHYENLFEQCQYCTVQGKVCTSMFVIHAFCDMAGPQKKAAKLNPSVYLPDKDPESKALVTLGFGQLHNLKAIQCSSRNWVLSNGQHNHSLKVVASIYYRDDDIGNTLKTKLPSSVIIGRDKQSDELSYRLASRDVQDALSKASNYQFSVLPEKVFEFRASNHFHYNVKEIYATSLDEFGNLIMSARYQKVNSKETAYTDGIICGDRSDVCKLVFNDINRAVTHIRMLGIRKRAVKRPLVANEPNSNDHAEGICRVFIAVDSCSGSVVRLEVNKMRNVTMQDQMIDGITNPRSLDVLAGCLIILHDTERVSIYRFDAANDFNPNHRCCITVPSTTTDIRLITTESLLIIEDKLMSIKHFEDSASKRILEFGSKISATSLYTQSGKLFVSLSDDDQPIVFEYDINTCQLIQKITVKTSHVRDVIVNISHDNDVLIVTANGAFGPSVIQYDDTATSIAFLQAIENGYNAIGYISPSMTLEQKCSVKKMSHAEALNKLRDCSTFLTDFYASWKKRVGSSCTGNGSLVKATIDCMDDTVKSVTHTIDRLKLLNARNMDRIFLYTLTNECIVERSFGFTSIKGGYYNKNFLEYCVAKRKVTIDMICRHTKTTFYTPSMNRKIYQTPILLSVNARDVLNEMRLINKNAVGGDCTILQRLVGTGYQVLKCVRNVLGKQPAKTNRFRWKKDPGYNPTMLYQAAISFAKGDVVPYQPTASEEIGLILVQGDITCTSFSKSDNISGVLLKRVDTEGIRYVESHPPVIGTVHISQMLRVHSAEIYIVPEDECKQGRSPNHVWVLPSSTVDLIAEGYFKVGIDHGILEDQDPDNNNAGVSCVESFIEAPVKSMEKGDTLIVDYENTFFVAVLDAISDSELTLKFMRRATVKRDDPLYVKFAFPSCDDIVQYEYFGTTPKEIVAKLLPDYLKIPRRGKGSSVMIMTEIVHHFLS